MIQMRKLLKFATENKSFDLFLVFFSVILTTHLNWDIKYIAIFAVTVWLILQPIKKKEIFLAVLFSIFLIPFLIFINREYYAEIAAVFAYFFIIVWLISSIGEYIKDRNK